MDADPEVRKVGRSAVFRRAVEAYLQQRRKRAIHDAYRRAYGQRAALDRETEGWEAEGVWPEP